MNRWLALLIAIVGGAPLGYGLLRIFFDTLAWLGFGMMDGPALAEWTDPLLGAAILGVALACWVLCGWLIWRALAPRHRGGQ